MKWDRPGILQPKTTLWRNSAAFKNWVVETEKKKITFQEYREGEWYTNRPTWYAWGLNNLMLAAVYCAIGFCCVHVIAAARSSSSARRRGGSDSELACMGSLRRALPLGIRNERLVLCTVFRVTRFFFTTLLNHRHFWAIISFVGS